MSPAQGLSIVLGAAMVLIALLLLWRRAPWRGARPKCPVVLVHGLLGFEAIHVGRARHYFNGIREALENAGIRVYAPALPPVGSVEARATALAEAVRAIPARKVHLIAHSMGGLDARYAIQRLGAAPRVRSLTTIGTPHRGSPVADLGRLAAPLFNRVGALALQDLTSAAAERFNRDTPNDRRVRYYSVVATIEPNTAAHPMLKPVHRVLSAWGPNDGVVLADSQEWGEVVERIACDHWAEIGWSKGYDPVPLYLRLTTRLRQRGG